MQTLDKHIQEGKSVLCKRSFYHFFKEFWEVIESQPLVDNWHIKFLCDELQNVVERIENNEEKQGNVVINISPGTSKSSIASVMLPVWCWVRKPTMKIITGSHANTLSLQLNTKSRDIIKSEKFKTYFTHIELKDDDNQKGQYSTIQGGQRTATSTGSSIIGRHGDIIIVDDIIPTSATGKDIERANHWLTQELNTRKTNKEVTPIILIMQRLAHNDPSATLLKDPNTIHICLPAEVDKNNTDTIKPETAKQYYTENNNVLYMDTIRLSKNILKDMKTTLGSRGYSTQFLQSPDPLDGGIIKSDWIKIKQWGEIPAEKLMKVTPNFYVDTAYTENRDNDPSAIIVAKELDNQLYIMNGEQFWLEFPELIRKITDKVNKEGYTSKSKVYVEPKACFDEDTLVKTSNGYSKISDINKGDIVYTLNEVTNKIELKPVINQIPHPNTGKDMVKITLKNGTTIKSTQDHEFYFNGTWTEIRVIAERAMEMGNWNKEVLSDIQYGKVTNYQLEKVQRNKYNLSKVSRPIWSESLHNCIGGERKNVEACEINTDDIIEIKYYKQKKPVYDLQIEDNHNFLITENDIIVHNSGKSLVQQLKRDTRLNVIEDNTLKQLKGGKEQRLESISPIVESGRVILIDGSWNDELINQITSLKPVHYDMRDCLIMAVQNELIQKKKGSGKYNYVRG